MKRVVFVFSSPTLSTKEYINIWNRCPGSREVDSDKLVIKGNEWEIFVFNGRCEKYYTGSWEIDILADEAHEILKNRKVEVGILLHGDSSELAELEYLINDFTSGIVKTVYYGRRGKFYNNYIVPFANHCSDDLFETLWSELPTEKTDKFESMSLYENLRFMKHRFGNFLTFMNIKITKSQKSESKDPLLGFINFRFIDVLNRYIEIENELVTSSDVDIKKVLNKNMTIASDIQNPEIAYTEALNLAKECMSNTQQLFENFITLVEAAHEQETRPDY